MSACETCKHWNDTIAPYGRREYLTRKCENEKFQQGLYLGKEKVDELYYVYDEGGWFFTGPKFGCIHHEDING